LKGERLCVVLPDPGGVKRAEMLREALEAALNQPVGKVLPISIEAEALFPGIYLPET
jgi:hypothetical protein